MDNPIELPGEANPLTLPGLVAVLGHGAGSDRGLRISAEQQLDTWSAQPGFYNAISVRIRTQTFVNTQF
jgi:hypothetical protein